MKPSLTCEECQRVAEHAALGWRGYLIDRDDRGGKEVVFFCPACVEREFQPFSNSNSGDR